MPRGLSDAQLEMLDSGDVRGAILMEFEYDSGTTRLWTGHGSLEYGGNTYQGAGQAISIGEISETTEVRAEGVMFTLSGVPRDLVSVTLDEPYQGRDCRALMAFVNDNNAIMSPVITMFEGRMDTKNINEGDDTVSIELKAENKLIDLNVSSNRRYTDEDQKSDYPDDDFFEYVPAIQDKEIPWGVG